jgi:hypothetical protein
MVAMKPGNAGSEGVQEGGGVTDMNDGRIAVAVPAEGIRAEARGSPRGAPNRRCGRSACWRPSRRG